MLQQPGEAALPSRGSLWTQDGGLQLIDSGSQGPETQPPPSSPGPPTSPCPALTSMHPTPACPQKCGAAALSSLFPPGASTCPCPLLCPTSSFPPLGGRLHGTACRKPSWCLWRQWPSSCGIPVGLRRILAALQAPRGEAGLGVGTAAAGALVTAWHDRLPQS